MNKWKELVASRRFWATLVSTVAALQCYRLGLVSGPDLAAWLKTNFGAYLGAVGTENVAAAVAAVLVAKKGA